MDKAMASSGTDESGIENYRRPWLYKHVRTQEMLADLKCEVQELSRKIASLTEGEVSRVSLNPDRTIVLPERGEILKQKSKIVNALRVEIELDKSLDLPPSIGGALLSYTNDIVNDVQALEQYFVRKYNQKEYLNDRIQLFEKSKESLHSFGNGLEEFKNFDVSDMQPLIMEDFNKIKGMFNRFLNMLSPNGALQEVLQELVRCSHGEGDEKYIDGTYSNFILLSMLRKASIVVSHPEKPSKMALDNF